MNPILPDNCFVPDGEARVMPDGRLYIYGSWDISGENSYCSYELHCFSTADLEHWTDHGVIFENDKQWCGIPWSPNCRLYAPDAIYKNNKYYLYVCGSGNEEGVAIGDTPTGPFSTAEKIEGANGSGIDPAVFVDDDGQAYYFWGQFHLRGGKLDEDMKTILPDSVEEHLLTEWEHGFHEGASIRKRGNKYYMVYTDISRGQATCLSYAMADHPLGPYKKCGTIIDNVYCDPQSWNNHGSIAEFHGKWYVFYHRSSQNKRTCRRICIEPITFDEKGLIQEVAQTSQGASSAFDVLACIPARTACRMMGNCYIDHIQGQEVLESQAKRHWGNASWAEYKFLDFGKGEAAFFQISVCGKGKITLKAENNQELCAVSFDNTQFEKVSVPVEKLEGIHAVWLFLEGEFMVKELIL